MRAFAELIDTLIYTRSREGKVSAIADFLKNAPDPDRGWALAALTESLSFPALKSATIRGIAQTHFDPELLRISRQYVGDTAETVALIWPDQSHYSDTGLTVSDVVAAFSTATRATAPQIIANFLDVLDANGRYALLKLATGGMRIGVSSRLAKIAFAQAFSVQVDEVDEYWHALSPPYSELFLWAAGGGPAPDIAKTPFFRPFMLSHPFEGYAVSMDEFAAEWKWDGIRVQIASIGGDTRLYSRGGDNISMSFPEIVSSINRDIVLDGELLVRGEKQGGQAASFNVLQQRLGRKTVSKQMLTDYPAFVKVYDVLVDGNEDIRAQPWSARRARLERIVPLLNSVSFDISPILKVDDFVALTAIRDSARDASIEGVMLKRRDSPYLAGRKVGHWYKWKRSPLTCDCVMLYAQRGNGQRASFYSDYTFGCWNEDGILLPVGKAYSGFTDDELKKLDKFVRENTVGRFGPVREVTKTLVLEIAFDSVHPSARHKSGLAMRFPRVYRIRFDKPASEADTVKSLLALAT